VNNDGFADVIIGAPEADPNGIDRAGSAYVYSGADGSLLHQFDGVDQVDFLGESVSGAGDVNNDGFADVIIGARGAEPNGLIYAGSAYVYSGADGSLLHQFDGEAVMDYLGTSVSGAGDVNNDGFADVIIGAPLADPNGIDWAGSAYVYSGADGSLLHQFDGEAEGDYFGQSVSGAGDVNNDGFADVIIGAPNADPNGIDEAGSAYVYSGADGSLLHQFDGEAEGDYFGQSVSGAGDVNNDGFADVIIGAPNSSTFIPPDGLDNLGSNGSAYVYSGTDGSLYKQFVGAAFRWEGWNPNGWFGVGWEGEGLGSSVAGVGDLNSDGFADVIIGGSKSSLGFDHFLILNAGSAYIHSPDCNGNGLADDLDVASGLSMDCNADGFPDECQVDCNGNSIPDDCDLANGTSLDLNSNLVPDECDPDCDGDGLPDWLALFYGLSLDCNSNAVPDECEIATGESLDCNSNGVPDACDISSGNSGDANGDGQPDECKPDCNENGVPDYIDISLGISQDCDLNSIPDECEWMDCNNDGGFDTCEILADPTLDQNGNGLLDECECFNSNYCFAELNSTGLWGKISLSGSGILSSNDLTLVAADAAPGQFGIFYYGSEQQAPPFGDPFGNGRRCVGGQDVVRLPLVTTDSSGGVEQDVDNTQSPHSHHFQPSTTWYFQFWFRDPPAGGSNFNLTDALSITFCP
jgi:hypothetical protein